MTTATIGYRKTKAGEWVLCGLVGRLCLDENQVTKRDGTTKMETVTRLGRPFAGRGGEQMVYGYMAARSGSGNWSGNGGGRHQTARSSYCGACRASASGMCAQCRFDEFDD